MSDDIIRLELPANYKYLNILSTCISAMLERIDGVADSDVLTYNLQLAIHEACTNIIAHAYASHTSGRIDITLKLSRNPRQLTIELHDTGCSFNIEAIPTPNLNEGQVHGYGLFLMRKLLDEVIYLPEAGNNHWYLVKKF